MRIGFWPVVHFIRPCSLFPIDNLSIYAQNFFKFCIHIVIGDEWYGIVNGQNPTILDGVTALSPLKKMVSGLLFFSCLWYLNETSQICWTAKVTYYNEGPSLLPFQFMSYPPLINLAVVPLLYEISEWNFTDMLTIKGYILWLRTSYHCLSQFCCYLGIIYLTK